ncbi:MAG: VOC family protein [Thermomicrobiales bacterium]
MLDYLHIGVLVDDLATAAERLQGLGFEIIWDVVDGGKPYDPSNPPTESFKVADPDGIVVDVSANPLTNGPGSQGLTTQLSLTAALFTRLRSWEMASLR